MTQTDATAPATIPQILAHAAESFGDASALEIGDYRASFRALEADCNRAAAAFIACGIRKGDRVAIWMPNSAEWIIASVGAQTAGAIIVPLNTRLKGKEAGYILRRSGARLLLTVDEFLGVRYPQLLAGELLPVLERIVVLSAKDRRDESGSTENSSRGLRGSSAAQENAAGSQQDWKQFLARGASVSHSQVKAARDRVLPDDIADIMFTSGTTGQPKGVMSAHSQNVRVYTVWSDTVGLQRGDRYLLVNPFFHAFGYKAGWLACLIRGATILPVPVFDAGEALRRIAADRVTVLPGPPALFQSLLAHDCLSTSDLSSLRLAVTGAANVPPILVGRMRSELGFKAVVTAYGLTETTGTVTICPSGDSDERIARTCGVPIPGIEVRCADNEGKSVAAGEPGEVLVRGYNVMRGYFDDAAATAEAIDAEGWLHTGDIGVLDELGYLRITDRKKDMFIVGGFNCYPAEVEKIMSEHPAIAQVAVIGVPDERMGEVGKAFVVLRPGRRTNAASLLAWCREHMANYKAPRHIELLASLPTNASGKVLKHSLRTGGA